MILFPDGIAVLAQAPPSAGGERLILTGGAAQCDHLPELAFIAEGDGRGF
jgi:hypothetical protein